ncbi:putative oxidoreductase [Sulfobacillus acidophilus TPY]|uniref:Glutamate synthase (NADPH) n=1 Tax=Sulfobacillus acidophilus (strain ATCC 700253 / DSM 10332 / NAL) TaxID=679936 RepID=G8TUS8_SULAD|nr:putative oxidoreductase [Sulfobacillus acidophilus TPY]AEW05802.1 Glutamate synthase (NADPH) [Sulfobacillus acidophilus DSM 10332]
MESWTINRADPFQEVVPPLSEKEARDEALRCYYCYDAPCIHGCPTAINIPVFIHQIAIGDLAGASRTILDANILGATCARICPTEALCEGACVRHTDSRPVSIGRLQRGAMDYAMETGAPSLPDKRVVGSGRVAIVGAGPAGLGAAAELRRLGYTVEVFEARPSGGGLDTYGIVSYREPVAVSLWEVEQVKRLGAVFHFNTRVGRDVEWGTLLGQYDAVVVAVGLGKVPRLGIPGEDLPGVWDALDLIEATKIQPLDAIPMGRRVAVIGAGNTAVDAATCAKRLGAEEVTILYRRGEDAMPAYGYEYAFAKADGVTYKWWALPVEIVGQAAVEGLRYVRTRVVEGAGSGRTAPLETVPGSERLLEVDTVIRAIGQEKPQGLWRQLGIEERHGRPLVDPGTLESSRPRVYIVGDGLARGGEATVVGAVADGKRVAAAIHRALSKTSNGE